MRGMEMIPTSRRGRVALAATLALLLGGSAGGIALAQSGEQERDVPYRSSIQVPDHGEDADDRDPDARRPKGGEGDEAAEGEEMTSAERAESARLQPLARTTAEQARAAAQARVPGTAGAAVLENEDGNLVFSVSIRTAAGSRDVKVDAGNGSVLHVEATDRDE